tara:strand:- start:1058 stop:1288 length:231 start_codon:yes stop_codon:yes gene_type:complete
MNTTQSLTPNEMTDRQFLGWNQQVRSQLVEDLYYTCRQDGEILEAILDEYVYLLKDNTERLDELQGWTNETLGEDN